MQDDKSKVVPIERRVPNKPKKNISEEPEMIELDRMIQDGKLDADRTIDYLEHEDKGGKSANKC